jgi:hypothetical protein
MPARDSWPRGLKALFWLAVIGLIFGSVQTVYWAVVTHEFFPQITIQGGYAALALLLAASCVAFGTLGHRRAFAVISLLTAVFNICVAAFFNLDILRFWLPDIIAVSWQALLSWDINIWIYGWNSFEIAVYALICYYLLRYEFRFFGFGTD